MTSFNFYCPTEIIAGPGSINNLPRYIGDAKRIIIVTGKKSAKKSGLTGRLGEILGSGKVESVEFAEAGSNPSITEVESIAESAKRTGAELIIGVGGGSAMDAAKAASVLATNNEPFYALLKKNHFDPAPMPLILIPTTAGTGSEVNQYALITDEKINDKVNLKGDNTYPRTAILDPELSVSMPKDITVDTGMDALCHAVEGFICKKSTPITDMLAREAFRTIRHSIPVVVNNPDDVFARQEMLYASTLAGIVISHTGTTIVHALGYVLTLRYGVPHGRANATAIADGLRYNFPSSKEKIGEFYTVFGGKPDESGVSAFKDFVRSLEVNMKLSDYGMSQNDIEDASDYIIARANVKNSPRDATREDIIRLLSEML